MTVVMMMVMMVAMERRISCCLGGHNGGRKATPRGSLLRATDAHELKNETSYPKHVALFRPTFGVGGLAVGGWWARSRLRSHQR